MSGEFFVNNTVESVLEEHYGEVSKLEDRELKRVLGLYKRVRQSIRDRLDSLQPGTFTAQRLAGVMAQVDSGIAQMNEMLTNEMTSSGKSGAELGIDQLVREIKRFEREFKGAVVPININAVEIASDVSNFLFNKYEASIEAYSSQVRSLFAQNLAQAAVEEISMGEVVARIGQAFMAEEWRLNRLVRTELMGVYSYGKLAGMKEIQAEDLPDLKKTLYHPMDKRTGEDSKILNRNNPIIPIDEPFVEDEHNAGLKKGQKRVYMAPPGRPQDRAILVPYRDSWSIG